MKKLLLTVCLLVGVVTLKAQGPGGPPPPPEERAKMFFSNQRYAAFAFTEEQKTKITPMLVKFYTSSDSLMATVPRDGGMEAFQAVAPKRAALGEPTEKAILAMLTPEQKKAYDAALAAAKERNPNATAVFTGGFGGRPRN
ncbi:hypothetical protein EXU57_24650 [Segetibacter sp. 3557_3]|uniref:hypothetical protein n=1 Tax=Segetibacter sp. 3557_3 TaxID=2547429 RepID=UPI001058F973|nr:hypothetical protein [Segetibacter sp. 3557_3]TDH17917.1 hypothetical protein EXU57_24650 [Segetibacter sp. 3557_3]